MKLQIGDNAPDFSFTDHDGVEKNFHDVKGKKIVFFFPKAFTPGCTQESCSIRDNYEDLKQSGITEVFGVSTDSKEKLKDFAEKYNLNFILVEDKAKQITKEFGVLMQAVVVNVAKRVTFVVDDQNKIIDVTNIGMAGKNTKYGLKDYGKELVELNFQNFGVKL